MNVPMEIDEFPYENDEIPFGKDEFSFGKCWWFPMETDGKIWPQIQASHAGPVLSAFKSKHQTQAGHEDLDSFLWDIYWISIFNIQKTWNPIEKLQYQYLLDIRHQSSYLHMVLLDIFMRMSSKNLVPKRNLHHQWF